MITCCAAVCCLAFLRGLSTVSAFPRPSCCVYHRYSGSLGQWPDFPTHLCYCIMAAKRGGLCLRSNSASTVIRRLIPFLRTPWWSRRQRAGSLLNTLIASALRSCEADQLKASNQAASALPQQMALILVRPAVIEYLARAERMHARARSHSVDKAPIVSAPRHLIDMVRQAMEEAISAQRQ
jgi:hypothetical protein